MILSKKTKIIASVSDSYTSPQIRDLYHAGVNVIRINFSHAKHENAARVIKYVKELNASGETNLSVLLDTKGPEIRTGDVQEKIIVKKGENFFISAQDAKSVEKRKKAGETLVFCDYSHLPQDVKKNQIIIIDSGLLKAKVVNIFEDAVEVVAMNSHAIGSRRHINLPGVKLRFPGMTEKDKIDIEFGIQQGIDFIGASFMRNKSNILEIKKLLKKHDASHIQIISKVENQEALENLEEIVQESDGVMVARGDLGVEDDVSKVPFFQKEIMDMCFKYGKCIVVATEMLKSMVESPFPTRAEVSDVYNAVVLRTDSTMLSEETAIGKDPVGTTEMMSKILQEAELHTNNKHKNYDIVFLNQQDKDKKVMARSALFVADELNADFILLFTHSGFLAKVVSAYKPNQHVLAFTKEESVMRGMNILYGIHPFVIDKWGKYPIEDEHNALEILRAKKIIKKGQKVIVLNDIIDGKVMCPYMKIIHI